MRLSFLLCAMALLLSPSLGFSQDNVVDDSVEKEIQAADPSSLDAELTAEDSPEEEFEEEEETAQASQTEEERAAEKARLEAEMRRQEEFARTKQEQEVPIGNQVNRYPRAQPYFQKPQGPKEGGVLKVPHPDAKKGLLSIDSRNVYRYKVDPRPKSKAASFRIASMEAPNIVSNVAPIDFATMYGEERMVGILFDLEWQPFKGFGSLGFMFGSGLSMASGQGTFKTTRPNGVNEARESYNLYIIPLSAFVNYRFEYARNQLFVPFINGGVTYYGMAEIRDDAKQLNLAGAPALGGGGGLHISLSRLNPEGAFALASEYDISDMWITLEGRVMQGLYADTEFTSATFALGVTVDY